MSEKPDHIAVRGGRVHNLRNIDVDIPLNAFTAIAGLSGSGKSSLAMGILYAEGSRRYLDALSTYTRRRISQVGRADVTAVHHIPAAIALRQRPNVPNERSTVGTMSESLNVLRLMFSRIASHRCPNGHQLPPSIKIAQAAAVTGEHMGEITCPICGVTFRPPSAEDFAFNSTGACPTCGGTGVLRQLVPERLIPDPTKTIDEGAVASWRLPGRNFMPDVARAIGVRTDVPFDHLTKKEQHTVLHGAKKGYPVDLPSANGRVFHMNNALFENAYNAVEDTAAKATNERTLARLDRFYAMTVCPTCHGSRFNPKLFTALINGQNIAQISHLTLSQLQHWNDELADTYDTEMRALVKNLSRELRGSLKPLLDLGLDYLTLDRAGNTLSTGELQRLQLGRTLRSETNGVLYVLDEPSVGLHPANVAGLVGIIQKLIALGNTVVVVDHDTNLLNAADYMVEMGPGAGQDGGTVIAHGSLNQVAASKASHIAPFLTGQAPVIVRQQTAPDQLTVHGTIHLAINDYNNLHGVTIDLPKRRLIGISGFSGAGKTSLILDSLIPAIKAQRKHEPLPRQVTALTAKGIRRVVSVNSVPVGKNARSTVATYSGIFDHIRALFVQTPAAQAKGWDAGHFSYNTEGGVCPNCGGTGTISLDIQYLPDMVETCPVCHGKRYNPETLAVQWHGLSIADVLDLSIRDALPLFQDDPAIAAILQHLADMGLGYLVLGESTPAISGGEAQRLKLVTEMGRNQKSSLFVFDEPSVGLHPEDVRTLLKVFESLREQGATIIYIEHDLDMLANADYLVDLGPRGGDAGGKIIAAGTPQQVAKTPASITGRYLAKHLH
ncbi:excinuclease ABC subunit UvrA [Schleiferilactobacillus harbinensis]|uniref:excinuclease ABC subunit UvrA n=1 Tax=Schleiferilactobacillus harbinensis TaxID=304207 RepID=UPI0039EB26E0